MHKNNSTKTLYPLFVREQIMKTIRDFFYSQNFHEVTPLMLQHAVSLEPTIHFFETHKTTRSGSEPYYLPASPEASTKKLIALGIGNCFAIAKSFRNLEHVGLQHLPEFLMLEWYRQNVTYAQIMEDAQKLIIKIKLVLDASLKKQPSETLIYQKKTIRLDGPWKIHSLVDLWKHYVHVDLKEIIADDAMEYVAKTKGYSIDDANWEKLYHQIFLNEIEPHLGIEPCFLVDFPARISPLCARNVHRPYLAERFELYVAGMELGNGNTENTNIKSIKETFAEEKNQRLRSENYSPPTDQKFLEALQKMHGTSYAGMGLGIDRLAMIFSDVKDISNVDPLYGEFIS